MRELLGRAARVLPKGPKLQLLNLTIFLAVVTLTLDFPTPIVAVLLTVAVAAGLDAALSRWRFGEWRVPWPSMVGATGICLMLDAVGLWPFVALAALMVLSKHLVRWRGKHLFNPNNFAASILLLAGVARIGVNEWGAAPQALALMLLFGTIATIRVDRFDLALMYLGASFLASFAAAQVFGWGLATVVAFAFSPLQILIGFFAITDPATSPSGRAEKLLYATLVALLALPAMVAGRVEAPVFALLAAAPQRHLIAWLVRAARDEPASAPAPGGGAP